jgi:predicted phage tail protein
LEVFLMELKGKPLSLGAKALGACIAVGSLALKATISPDLDIDAALKAAAFVVLVFAPVDLSMIMGNIFNTRSHGGGR